MSNTENNPLQEMSSLLLNLETGLSKHAIVNQVSLLAAWAWLSRNAPELGLPAPSDSVGVTNALLAMEETCFEPGVKLSQRADLLELECPGRIIQSLQSMVAQLFWPDRHALIRDLVDIGARFAKQSRVETTLPVELASFMASLANVEEGSLLATYPMSDVPMALADTSTSRTLVMQQASPLAEALAIICGAKMMQDLPESTLLTADVVLSSPPWGQKSHASRAASKGVTTSEGLGLLNAWEQSRERAVVLVAPHVLFRGTESQLREELVRDSAIDMVIQLPERTLWHTAVAPVLVVLDHQLEADAPILFVDADRLLTDERRSSIWGRSHNETFWEALTKLVESRSEGQDSRHVSKAEVERNDFDLSVNRYVMGDATQKMANLVNARPLQDVAEIVRAQTLKSEEEEGGTLFIEVGGRDIDTTGQVRIEAPPKELHVAGRTRKRAEQQQLRPGDVLLISKGSIGRVALVGSECGDNWVAGQVFLILRAQERGLMQPEYLYRYLASPMVQQYLEEIASGAGIPILKANDIKNLPVPVPSQEEQKRVLDVHQKIMDEYDAIRVHKAKIEELSRKNWPI